MENQNLQNMFLDDDSNVKQKKKTTYNSNEEVTEDQVKKETEIPSDYIPIKLSSVGKLDAPKTIHVKNYTGQDALDLSIAKEDDTLYALIKVLKGMVYEDFDPELFHVKELEEILLNIYANFWSSILSDYPYPWIEEEIHERRQEQISDLEKDKLNKIENKLDVPRIDIPITQLETKNIPQEFKEPIQIKGKDKKISFMLPRIGHLVNAKKYVDDIFFEEKNELADIEEKIQFNKVLKEQGRFNEIKKIDKERHIRYEKLQEDTTNVFLKVNQCQTIVAINDKLVDSIEDKLKEYNNISLVFWRKFNEEVVNKIDFGIKNDLTVESLITGKEVTRRFQFRLLDFIPSMDLPDSSGLSVTFGS